MIRPRPEVLDTPAVRHGGTTAPGVLDFSANLNPFGPSPRVVEAVRAARWDAYPDPDAVELRRLLADRHGVDLSQIMVGNGGSELIDLACRAFVRPGDRVAIDGPTYGEYGRAARLAGGVLGPPEGTLRVRFVCSPNNPTGVVTPAAELLALADRSPDTLLVVDEAYAECVPGFESVIGRGPANLLVLQSLTKAHGLAGLRVGYAVGATRVVEALRRVRVPWAVNAIALAAGAAAVRDQEHTRRTVADWHSLRDDLVERLRGQGLTPVVAATPFFLLPDPPGEPWSVRLRTHGIAVRDCSSFGLPGFARISPRLGPENARLVAAVADEWERR
jgi:histidinol-phosphate/aromatic aminotransferase/cobyric acid decarboxylase-like protein